MNERPNRELARERIRGFLDKFQAPVRVEEDEITGEWCFHYPGTFGCEYVAWVTYEQLVEMGPSSLRWVNGNAAHGPAWNGLVDRAANYLRLFGIVAALHDGEFRLFRDRRVWKVSSKDLEDGLIASSDQVVSLAKSQGFLIE